MKRIAFIALLFCAAFASAQVAPRPPARPPLQPPKPSTVSADSPARVASSTRTSGNLCWNGSFDHPTNTLDGWMADYQWEGNSHYMQNHTRVRVLPTHAGRSDVLHVDGSAETKVESKPIPFEPGARYRCTLLMNATTQPHIYFSGYKWVPGVRPYEDPHIGDLRKIYKSEFRNHDIKPAGSGWQRVTFEFPLPTLSELGKKHLKEVRFLTVYLVIVSTSPGQAYIDDVEVTKIP